MLQTTSNLLPRNMLLAYCRQHVACISATYYYSFLSQSICIPSYPATDGQQTGKQHAAGARQHVARNMLPGTGNMLPWCKRGLIECLQRYISLSATVSAV